MLGDWFLDEKLDLKFIFFINQDLRPQKTCKPSRQKCNSPEIAESEKCPDEAMSPDEAKGVVGEESCRLKNSQHQLCHSLPVWYLLLYNESKSGHKFKTRMVLIKHYHHKKTSQECETALTSQYQTLYLVFVFCLFVFLPFLFFVMLSFCHVVLLSFCHFDFLSFCVFVFLCFCILCVLVFLSFLCRTDFLTKIKSILPMWAD